MIILHGKVIFDLEEIKAIKKQYVAKKGGEAWEQELDTLLNCTPDYYCKLHNELYN